jgi:hypothetical protein
MCHIQDSGPRSAVTQRLVGEAASRRVVDPTGKVLGAVGGAASGLDGSGSGRGEVEVVGPRTQNLAGKGVETFDAGS